MKDFVEAYKEAPRKSVGIHGSQAGRMGGAGEKDAGKPRDPGSAPGGRGHGGRTGDGRLCKGNLLNLDDELQGFMVQLAAGEHDAVTCPECSRVFRAGWMNGRCPYCEAEQNTTKYVCGLREAAGK